MANLVHTTATRNAMADVVVDLINVTGPGYIEFQTAADVELATVTFQNPAFGAAAAGVATAAMPTLDESSADAGTIAKFQIFNGAALEVLSGDVTAIGGGGDIEISTLLLAATDKVSLTALTYTAAT